MAWFGRGKTSDEPTLEQLRTWHLLVLPVTVAPEAVDLLVRARVPDARLADTRRARLGRNCAISGPHDVDEDEAVVIGVPAGLLRTYALEVPLERDAAAFDDIADPVLRAWWMRAFPTGKPYRDEGDAIDLALALARRLGGAVRCAGTNVVLEPDPRRLVDLTVWSGYWLEPQRLVEVLAPLLPGAHVDLGGREWTGPLPTTEVPWSVDPLDPLGVDLHYALDAEGREVIAEVGAATDAEALAGRDVVDGFAVTADNDLTVEVIQEDAVPLWVRERVAHQMREPADPVVSYRVRWLPDDVLAQESEQPTPELRSQRERVRLQVHALALALAEVTAGVISDGDEFEVDRYRL